MPAPYVVSPMNGVFDPATGRLIGVAEQGPSGTTIRKLPGLDANSQVIDPATGTPVSGGGNVLSVSGVPEVGQTLTAVLNAGWYVTGYQWQRTSTVIATGAASTADISGATSASYVVGSADASTSTTAIRLSCRVTGLVYAPTGVQIGVDANPFMIASDRQEPPRSLIASAAGTVYSTDAVGHLPLPYAITSPRLCFFGLYCDQNTTVEHAVGNDTPVQGVSIEVFDAAGVSQGRVPVTVNGSASFTIPNGGYVWTDENSITIPAGYAWRTIVATNVPAGQNRACAWSLNSGVKVNGVSLDGVRQGSTDQSSYLTGTGALLVNTGTKLVAPGIIVARGWAAAGKPAVPLLLGDSIGAGNNDNQYDVPAEGVFGFLARGLVDSTSSAKVAYCNMCVPGVSFGAVAAGTFDQRRAALAAMNWPFTCVISEMGTNAGGSATAIAAYPAFSGYVKGLGAKKLIQTTMLEKSNITTANVGTTTLANQTAVDFSEFDSYIKTRTDPNIDAYIDIKGLVGNGSVWLGQGLFSATLAADFVSGTNTLSLTAAPPLYATLMLAAGTASVKNFGVVTAVTGTGPYTVTLRNGVTGSGYVAGTTAQEVYCAETSSPATHPVTRASIVLAAAVIAAKNSGVIV